MTIGIIVSGVAVLLVATISLPAAKANEEKMKRTTIVAYKKNEFSDDEILEEMERIQKECQCDVQNLKHVGVFLLTYQNSLMKSFSRMRLDDKKEIGADDFEVNLINNVDTRRAPDDPMYTNGIQQWPLINLINGADISMQAGWDEFHAGKSCGDPRNDVTVAVIDSGVDYNHPDLNSMMWRNTGEIPGNEIDDDGNGVIDDIYGADFTLDPPTGDPMERQEKDENGTLYTYYGHGTHCAGIIGAQERNGEGMAGVASYSEGKVKLMAIKGLSRNPATGSGLLRSLNYAIANGASISSNSWGAKITNCVGDCYNSNFWIQYENVWRTVFQNNPDHLFITAAGNDNRLVDVNYRPLACGIKEPNVLCVASSNIINQKSTFSNYGKEYVHVFAPGTNINSTYPLDHPEFPNYHAISGTSMACPHVAGLAALIRVMNKDLNAQEVRSLIEAQVVQKSAYSTLVSTGGIIDAEKTLHAARIPGKNMLMIF